MKILADIIRKLFAIIDPPFSWLWRKVTDLFCRATHLDNWWLARILVACHVLLMVTETALIHLHPFAMGETIVLTSAWSGWAIYQIEKLRKKSGGSGEVLVVSKLGFDVYIWAVLITALSLLYMLVDITRRLYLLGDLAMILLGGALWVATIVTPKRPSRTKSTIRNLRESIKKIPSAIPVPVPG